MFNRLDTFFSGVMVTVTGFFSNTLSHVTNVIHNVLNEVHTLVTGLLGHVSALFGGAHTPASSQIVEAFAKAAAAKAAPAVPAE